MPFGTTSTRGPEPVDPAADDVFIGASFWSFDGAVSMHQAGLARRQACA